MSVTGVFQVRTLTACLAEWDGLFLPRHQLSTVGWGRMPNITVEPAAWANHGAQNHRNSPPAAAISPHKPPRTPCTTFFAPGHRMGFFPRAAQAYAWLAPSPSCIPRCSGPARACPSPVPRLPTFRYLINKLCVSTFHFVECYHHVTLQPELLFGSGKKQICYQIKSLPRSPFFFHLPTQTCAIQLSH